MAHQHDWKDRKQESLASAVAALKLAGFEIDAEQLREASEIGAGRYSDLSLLNGCSDLFRALKKVSEKSDR